MDESDPLALTELAGGESTAPTGSSDQDLRAIVGMGAIGAPAALARGQILDDVYRIERAIGAGGMGAVYLATDLDLSREVAIKVHVASREPGDHRLVREAAALARLAHPNVVTVFRVGWWASHPYVAMELVRGGTLRRWLSAPRTVPAILAMFAAAGEGLAAAHRAGLVHRDFKPDNVLIGDDGRPRVADFGLVIAGADEDVELAGTPAYMAPEQWGADGVDARADQFAFAVALWEALHGSRPFPAADRDGQRTASRPPSSAPPSAPRSSARTRGCPRASP